MKKIAVVLISFLFVACASSPKTNSSQVSQPMEATKSSPDITNSKPITNSVPEIKAPVPSADVEANKLAAELRVLQNQSIYFDFDSDVVKSEYLKVIRQQAEFLRAHKNDIVTVSGNADERGSTEYNLALGEERAKSVQRILRLLAVPAEQIKVVSLGEEKPRLSCHAEKCWQENRRDDFDHKLN